LKQNLQAPLLIGASLAVAFIAANLALTLRNTKQLNEDNSWVAHTHEVMTGLANVMSLTTAAETGQRGFVITGEPEYLEPYHTAVAEIDSAVANVERLTSDNSRQQERLPDLRQRIADRLQALDRVIAVRKSDGIEGASAAILTGEGRRQMIALRHLVSEMIDHEQDLLRDRMQRSERTYKTAMFTGLLSGLAAIAAIVGFTILLKRYLTARAKAAATIAEQGERWRTTLASIGDAVIATDREGRITTLNPVAEALTGWNSADAVGRSLTTVFHIVNETSRQLVDNPALRALSDGMIVGLANHTILIAKDGNERAIDDSAAPIRCKDGEIVGAVLVFRDVTERRQAEFASEQNEARMTAMFETAGDCIISMDQKGTITEFNAAAERTFGHSRQDVLGRELAALIIPPEFRELHRKGLAHYLATGEGPVINQRLELSALRADGAEFPTELTVTRIPVDGPPIFTAYLRDITERKRGEQALRESETRERETANELRQLAAELSEADRRKNEFLAMLAHELRNPLAPIRNALQIVQLSQGNAEAVLSVSEMMERQIAQLVRLVDDLLDVSRISRGKIELRRERVELGAIIQQAVETSRPAIECARHNLTVTLPLQPVYLEADPIRLAQVFSNLLNNSCKYTEPDGRISVTAERKGSDVVIAVNDSGVGIPPEMLPKVFDIFTQVDKSLERSQGGLGIGLTLVQRIVELHGGTVTASSAGTDKGSEFVVRLPMLIDSAVLENKPVDPKPTPIKSHRILVVDDNQDSAASLAMLLKLSGNETKTAFDGQSALEVAEAFRPDIVLLDIGLPKLNGYEVARKIRDLPSGKNAILVALTGWGQDEDRQKSKDAGFDGHLVKPVEQGVLTKLLGDLLSVAKS
jgi:PAS domain S-box-containing protein